MDFWFVAAVSALLLFSVDSKKTLQDTNVSPSPVQSPNSSTTIRTEPTTQPCPALATSRPALRLGFLTIRWGQNCEGKVILSHAETDSPKAVCYSSIFRVQHLLRGVCEEKKGCKGKTRFEISENESNGFEISENGETETQCETLWIKCKESMPTEKPPLVVSCDAAGYKVATVLLCIVLIALFLIRFTKPTVKALQKRLSNKRQNRWIGPTQSHSVSYHRGQAVNKNMDGEKHSSYPALDRLVVGNREPSSNRSSYNV